MKKIEGILDAKGRRFAIVISRFNEFITKRLLDGAIDCILRHNGKEEDIEIIWVPGTVEAIYAVGKIVNKGKYDAVICLSAVIRGETPHFDYVASQISRAIAQFNMTGKIPVAFGVITADTTEQAIERAGTKMGNKGWMAALSAIEMVDLSSKI
ncbi:6,7-dimethyl-8-ribityllumazine synthase [bacterium]|nr:6,7-dimethyl-8-ribityllumazine synthase [bacterium]